MSGADLVVHHQFLANLADRLSDHFKVGASAHPRGPQDGAQQAVSQDVLKQIQAPTARCQRIGEPADFLPALERVFGDIVDQRSRMLIFAHYDPLLKLEVWITHST
ncbi:MAG: hypothetical protein WBE69_04615, partial [Candidatus Binataceae bacterium]